MTYYAVEIDALGRIHQETPVTRAQLKKEFRLEARTVRMLDREHRQSPLLLATEGCIFFAFNHVQAIITHDRALLFDPRGAMPVDSTLSVFRSHLAHVQRQHTAKRGLYMPYEFIVLEFLLIHLTDGLERRYAGINETVKELLEEARETEGATLDRLLPMKYGIGKFEINLAEVSAGLKNVLDNDEDMSMMYLSVAQETGVKRKVEMHHEIESLLEAYMHRVDEVENEVKRLIYNIRSTEKTIQIKLASVRNQIMKMELLLTISTFAVSCGALTAGLFGMNLMSGVELHPMAFYGTAGAISLGVMLIGRGAIKMCTRNRITFFSKPVASRIPRGPLVNNSKAQRVTTTSKTTPT
jgi:magnesium transporter